jgi:hypothetical protein
MQICTSGSVYFELGFCVTEDEKILAMGQAASRRLHTAATRFDPRSDHVGFVVDKVALRQVSSEYFGFPCQFSFH